MYIEQIIECFKNNDLKEAKKIVKENYKKTKSSSGFYHTEDNVGIGEHIYNLVKENKPLMIDGNDVLPELIEFLFECDYPCEYESYNGNNILTCASYHNNLGVAKILVNKPSFKFFLTSVCDKPFYDEELDDEPSSPLRYAIEKNHTEMINLILDNVESASEEYWSDSVLKYVDEEVVDDAVLCDLEDANFNLFTYAVFVSTKDVVERILEINDNEIEFSDKTILSYLDWNSVPDGLAKKRLIEEKTGYKPSIYAKGLIKNKNSKSETPSVSLDGLKEQIKNYLNKVTPNSFLVRLKNEFENDSFAEMFDICIKAGLLIITAEQNKEPLFDYYINIGNLTNLNSNTFTNIYYSYDEEKNLEFIKEQILPIYEPCFTILMLNTDVDYEKEIRQEFLNILYNWETLITSNETSNSKFIKEIKESIYKIDYDEKMKEYNNEVEIDMTDRSLSSSPIDKNYKPVQLVKMGATISRQQYINADDAFYVYLGADVKNPNTNFTVEGVNISVLFYNDGMLVDTHEDRITIIDCNETFHYATRCYVREEFDNYTVMINGGTYEKVDQSLNLKQHFEVSNLRYRVDKYDNETKLSCQFMNRFPRDIRSIEVFVHLLKNGQIVAGVPMYKYDIASGGVYALVEEAEMSPDFDEVVYSVSPNL